jgi:predicted cupin superfamily sugar epimerase
MSVDPRAAELIRILHLEPHPEGGFYREVFRSDRLVSPRDGRPDRPALTTILFLLPQGAISRWHRVQSDEVWHLYEGGPLELRLAPPDLTSISRIVLGPALASDGPVYTVRAGWWQSARPLARHALAGCTVGPGFDFADFTMLDDDPEARSAIGRLESSMG